MYRREQERWNTDVTVSIWGPSSPSTSPDPMEFEETDFTERNNKEFIIVIFSNS